MVESQDDRRAVLDLLRAQAMERGAGDAAVVPAEAIRTEQRLADMCTEPRCPSYGLSASCPPHVEGPAAFADLLAGCSHGLVVKLEVASETLLSAQRSEVFQVLHELVAGLEAEAGGLGFARAHAFAGSNCKGS